MKVEITKTKLEGKCLDSGKIYEIHHAGKDGKDMTSLAKIASKSSWFTIDNPQFKPGTIQNSKILENGRIEILNP